MADQRRSRSTTAHGYMKITSISKRMKSMATRKYLTGKRRRAIGERNNPGFVRLFLLFVITPGTKNRGDNDGDCSKDGSHNH